MGLLDKIFPKTAVNQATDGYFKTFTAYQPVFYSFSGGIYEAELCRAAIHTFAIHCSKLKPEVQGSAAKRLNNILQFKPNPYMDTTKFLYKVATILETENTAFIVPMYDRDQIVGFYPVKPSRAEIRELNGVPYLSYEFGSGQRAAMELSSVGVINKFFYESEFFGENNNALNTTLQLITTQNNGIAESVKQSASIRFLAKLSGTFKSKEIEAERLRFSSENLSMSNSGGVMMYDQKYDNIIPIDSKPYAVPDEQYKMIRQNVFNYFNVSEGIIQNKWSDEEWNAYYEGKIEPFAIQLSLVLTNMIYNQKELAFGNRVICSANRLQYASPKTKLEIVTQLFDRGMMSRNMGLEIFNMPPVEKGDEFFIRGEYINTSQRETEPKLTEPKEPEDAN